RTTQSLFFVMISRHPTSPPFPYTTLFRSNRRNFARGLAALPSVGLLAAARSACAQAKYPTHSPRLVLPFAAGGVADVTARIVAEDRKSTRLNSSHVAIPYAVFCLKKKQHA